MGNWGDEWDPEVKDKKDPKGRVTLNFKKITADVDEILAATVNVDDKHPKNELMKEWVGAMLGFFLIFLVSYKYACFVTIPFMLFYALAVFRIAGAWKTFKYKRVTFWLMTIACLSVMFVITYYIKVLAFGA